MSPKKRRQGPVSMKPRATPGAQLTEVRAQFRTAISKLKDLGCADSMVLVEFWHALDCVNSEEGREG